MTTPEEIFKRAERYFFARDSSCGDVFRSVTRLPRIKSFLEEELKDRTLIDVGCGKLLSNCQKITEFPVTEYIGIDPYLIPNIPSTDRIKYFKINPLEFLADQEPESAVCMVCNLDQFILYQGMT
ncbi:MAG: hypothetical protein KJ896_03040, partial [Nanoarchaeota archaeon]|nr:hypothetical protein [Nanoarchaeota archaeon]